MRGIEHRQQFVICRFIDCAVDAVQISGHFNISQLIMLLEELDV